MYLLLVIILVIIILFVWYGAAEYMNNYSLGGGYLSQYVHGKSYGKPLVDTVYTSGATLRDLGTVFSSTDQGRHEQL